MLKRILRPIARPAVRHIRRYLARRKLRALSMKEEPATLAIVRALRLLGQDQVSSGEDLIAQIERERQRLLAHEEPLVDGSLGSGGLYDEGETVADACRASKPPLPARLLYLMLREFEPQHVLELGTNLGISSAYFAAALRLNGSGKVITLEASPYRQRIARELHDTLGLENVEYVEGLFTDMLAGVLEASPPFDAVFIDGHHQYQPTLDYFEAILEHTTDGALVIFDDIRWSDGMWRAWRKIMEHDQVVVTVDLRTIGVCVTQRTATKGERMHVRKIHLAALQ